MSVTIKDIAKKAGVSPSTVSRVVNGNSIISPETRERILEIMEQMNYHPNSLARKFANKSTYTIALVIDAEDEKSFANTFFNRSVYAIEKVAFHKGYNLLIMNDNDHKNASTNSLILEKQVDGLILPPSKIRKELIELLETEEFPYTVLGESPLHRDTIRWVDIDNYGGSQKAVDHLMAEGYRQTALIIENISNLFEKKRVEGYSYAIRECGTKSHREVLVEFGSDKEAFGEAIIGWIKKGVDSFICSNNIIAFELMKVLKRENIRIPEDIGIITFDNYPFAEYMDPPLSVIDINTYRLGEVAAEMLIEGIKNKETGSRQILIDTDIIVRESSIRGNKNDS